MTADIFGLVLNFIGAIALAISATIRGNLTAGILEKLAKHHEDAGAEKLPEHTLNVLRKKNRISKSLSLAGFILLIVGFGLQIVCLHFDCFESACSPQ